MSSPYSTAFMQTGTVLGSSSGMVSSEVVHERAAELIQGGSAGQHYHLTAMELSSISAIPGIVGAVSSTVAGASISLRDEPIMIGGAYLTVTNGDILMGRTL